MSDAGDGTARVGGLDEWCKSPGSNWGNCALGPQSPQPPQPAFFDDDRPQYHVQPPAGWMNDPNGPIYYKGRYHMFYQYLPEKCEWDFGIVWGHAYSEDLVHWEHLEPALVPSPGWVDADGCFSGCCVLGEDGKPIILYTGVRLRSNHETGPLPPSDQDLGMAFIESQCAAVPADEDDDLLVKWDKLQVPFLKLPPKSERFCLTGWRDPFIVYDLDGCAADHDLYTYHMLIGSGIKDQGGTALVYGSKRLDDGWELLGLLCEGKHEEDNTGIVWECPLVVRLNELVLECDGEQDPRTGVSGQQHRTASRLAPTWLWRSVRDTGKTTSAQRLSSADLVLEAGGVGGVAGELRKSSMPGQKSNLGRTRAADVSKASQKQPGFSMLPNQDQSNVSSLANQVADTSRTKKNPSISLLAQKLEQFAIANNSNADRNAINRTVGGVDNTDDGSSSEAPSIASRVNSAMLEDGVDSFEALKARVKPLNVSRAITEEEEGGIIPGIKVISGISPTMSSPGSRSAPNAQAFKPTDWHLFTVSPDAPTNPVLYWVGRMMDRSDHPCPKFDIGNAQGPFKLDLGDILYAPNVCQDGCGRWLLWGWLQERRKVGSYAYAGCLTLPRVLHVTSTGRLIQAPVPEVDKLRTSERKFAAQRVALHPDTTYPIKYVRSERLDIQCSIERGSSTAAGLLFRSHEAEADGSTAIIYDWSTNQLEAIFNVPPTWKPHPGRGPPIVTDIQEARRRDSEDSNVSCDPAAMLSRTPRRTSLSTDHSVFDTLIETGRSSPFSPGPGSPQSCSEGDFLSRLASPSPSVPISTSIVRSGSSMAMAMHRSSSVTNLATGTSYSGTSHLGTSCTSGSQLMRGFSLSKEAGAAGMAAGTSANAMATAAGSLTNFLGSTPSMLNLADMDGGEGIEDEDLGNLLEDLAAPMRHEEEAAGGPAHAEPRRVGGPLAMQSNQILHLRIFVDHSSIEVFTGTGECLSTRIYRGRGPNPNNPGIEFVSFGGQATIDSCECYEMVSCWKGKVQTPIIRRSFDSSLRSSLDQEDPKFAGLSRPSSRPMSVNNSFVQRIDSHSFVDRVDSFCVDSTQTDIISPPLTS